MFLLAGASVVALKLPLLAMNVAVTLLLIRIFCREVGLRPALALIATLFFVHITFITNERIVVASTDSMRIPEYKRIVDSHRSEAVRISRTPCPGGREVIEGVFFCSP